MDTVSNKKKTTPVSRVLYPACAGFHHLSMRPTLRGRTGHPSMQREKKIKPSAHSRFTWSYSPQGLSEPTSYLRCWWALTPPFHPYPVCTWRFKFLQHYLSSCCFRHDAPAFHRVRCPLQPGLSSPHEAERWNGVVWGKYS